MENQEVKEGYKLTEVGVIPEDWEVKELGKIGDLKNGINKNKRDFGFGYPFVNLLDVFGNKEISNQIRLGFVNCIASERNQYDLIKGDVLFIRSSVKPEGVGLTSVVIEDLVDSVYSGFLIRFREIGRLTLNYKKYCFYEEGFRKRVIDKSTVSANTNINQDSLKTLKISFPQNKQEQEKIAQVLSDFDRAIAHLDKLISKKRNVKQGTMQQLLTGKKRLPGFSGEWKERKLEDIGNFFSGGTPRTSNSDFYGGHIPWITSSDLNKGKIFNVEGRITQKGLDNSSAKLVKKGSVLIAMYGATAGVIAISLINGAINQAILAIELKQDDVYFLYSKLSSLKDWLIDTYTQGGQPNLSGTIIKSIQISIPPLPEQKAIAQILTDMDTEIEALEKKRNKYQAIKQGMMQELLTGKTRLK